MSFNPESMLKGRMAESLVEELFTSSENKIYRFGYEAILQNLTQIEKSFNRKTETGEMIQTIPDFIIIGDDKDPAFLEVKFRGDGRLHINDHKRLQSIKNFWKAKVIIVNSHERPYFNISEPPYFDDTGKFITKPFMEENLWKINPEAYEKAESLVEKYLSKPLIAAS